MQATIANLTERSETRFESGLRHQKKEPFFDQACFLCTFLFRKQPSEWASFFCSFEWMGQRKIPKAHVHKEESTMRNTYADPTANTAIARVDRERRLAEQKKKREEEHLLRSLTRPAPSSSKPRPAK